MNPSHRVAFFRNLTLLGLALAAAPVGGEEAETESSDGGLFGFLRSEVAEKYDLDPAAPDELLGVVVDADDKGVAGATVYLRPRGDWNDLRLRATKTDDRGQYVFRRLEVGRYHLAAIEGARASRTNYRKWLDAEFKPDLSREPVVLRLKPARRLRVQVVDAATKEPIAGAMIRGGFWDLPRNRKADVDGRTLFEGLYPKSYDVSATAPGYAKKEQGIGLKNQVDGELTLELEPGAILTGVVTDPDGEPIPRPRVHLRDPINRSMYFDFMTGTAEGVYRFNHAPVGMSIIVDVDRDGYVGKEPTIRPLRVGETREFNATLQADPPGGSVVGVVTNEAEEPIAEATLRFRYGDDRVFYTDTDGRFRIDDIPHRLDKFIVKAPKHAGRVVPFKQGTEEQPGRVTVVLKPGGKVRGRIVNEAGEPIAGASAEFPNYSHGTAGERVKVGADGLFSFDTVPEQTDFRFTARGYSDLGRQKLPLDEDRVLEIVLIPEGYIKGLAIDDATGEPLPKFNVRMTFSPDRRAGDPSGGIDTDWDSPGRVFLSEQGEFEIDDLVVGQPMIVTVEADGYRPATIRRVEAARPESEGRVEFRLEPIEADSLLTVAGVIADSNGAPVADAEVRLFATVDGKNQNGDPLNWRSIQSELEVNDRVLQAVRAATDEQGRFRFEGVYADCVIEIAYWRPGTAGGRLQGIERMSPEEQTSLAIETLASARLVVTLDKEAFKDASSIEVRSTKRYDDPAYIDLDDYRPDADGAWVIEEIPPGEYTLSIQRHEYTDDTANSWRSRPMHKQTISFEPGEEKRLHLDEPNGEEEQQGLIDRMKRAAGAVLR